MERPIKAPWDPSRDERLDEPPQPRYTPPFIPNYTLGGSWGSIEKATSNLRTFKMPTTKEITLPTPKPELESQFPELKERIKEIFDTKMSIRPESITLYKSPEDGEEAIIVTVPLGDVSDPLEELLSIKRKLRRINRELAKSIVILPSD